MNKLSHVNKAGKAKMVDVSPKPDQFRKAKAEGHITLGKEAIRLVKENKMKKGDVLTVAEIAGIQGGKQTSGLIPLCHPLPLSHISVTAAVDRTGVKVISEATFTGKTGVEMEALTAVSVALLTVYDMCKAVDKAMVIDRIRLISKTKQ
ncbi:MAG TPA: cyclic pyranopterin monophosphate synthase MoaC [Bacteroidales bacterium]|nr:cyclic pyranopterin monophosphate synthase MoaC [Bacteroidales bacterium]